MMKPNESQLGYLQGYWGPARVLILEEFTMCPAEGYNMGLLRSAYGRARQCGRNVDEYLVRGNFWGGIPIVIQLGDPLRKRPVKAASLLDTKEMLLARIAAKQNVSIETQDAIKVFRQFDIAFELTATKRFKDEWLPKLLLSMRQADSATGRLLDRDLWNVCVVKPFRCTDRLHPFFRCEPRAFEKQSSSAPTPSANIIRPWYDCSIAEQSGMLAACVSLCIGAKPPTMSKAWPSLVPSSPRSSSTRLSDRRKFGERCFGVTTATRRRT